jgi:RNA polymerase sigma-70 factor (ECF subfamily)
MSETTSDVWKAFGDRLRRFIRRRVGSEADADDALQDVFARIHSGLGRLRDPAKLEAWLFQVARRAIVDQARSRRRPDGGPRPRPAPAAAGDVPAEVASWLRPMMDLLAEEDREALRLADLEGVPQKELAARLGLSPTGARSRVQRARRRLKQAVLDCCRVELDRRGNPVDYTPRRPPCGTCSS